MRKRQSKWMLLTIATVLGTSVFMTQPEAMADTLKDMKNEQKQLEQKKNQLNSTIIDKKGDISENQSTQEKILSQIQSLDSKIIETDSEIDRVLGDIKRTNLEIEKLQDSILVLKKKIAERDELIKERLRAVQESGGSVNYLDVLLGSSSFADFIDRFSAVSTLMDADRKILQEQADDKKSLEEQKTSVEDKLAQQEQRKEKLVGLKANLDSQKASKNKLIDQLEAEQAKLVQEKSVLEKEYDHAHNVSKELENKIVKEQARLIELARQAEIARKKKEAAERAKAQANSGKNNSGGSLPVVSSGTWTRPAVGTFTSGYKNRGDVGFGAKFHHGIDTANAHGTQIVAAADGIVSYAGSMNGFGNVIMITHSIDGQIFTTVYGHLSGIDVSSGTSVSKGQAIGRMGNTGNSTGTHLHFEIHVGPWNGKSTNSVNPLRYVSL